MRRRDFLALLGGAAAGSPLAARAQQPVPVIGFLSSFSQTQSARPIAEFRRGLNDSGLTEKAFTSSSIDSQTVNTTACRVWRRN